MQNTKCKIQNAKYTIQNAKYKLQNIKCKMQNAKAQCKTHNAVKKIKIKIAPLLGLKGPTIAAEGCSPPQELGKCRP